MSHMQMYHSFDTHKIVKNFIKKGISEPQAEVIVEAIADSRDTDISHLATKSDLMEVKEELKGEVAGLRVEMVEMKEELKGEMAELKVEMVEVKAEILRVESTLIAEMATGYATLAAQNHATIALIHSTKSQLLIWFISIMIATTTTSIGAIAGLVFWFFKNYLAK